MPSTFIDDSAALASGKSKSSEESDLDHLRHLVVDHYRSALDLNRHDLSDFMRGLVWAYQDVLNIIDSRYGMPRWAKGSLQAPLISDGDQG
jgi:hypothetical protein